MTGRLRTAPAVMALGATLVLGACTAETDSTPSDPAASSPTDGGTPSEEQATDTAAEEAWRRPLEPIGQPVRADDVAVVYSHRGRRLFLSALDPDDGSELWRRPASPGELVTGIAVTPRIVGTDSEPLVAYFRPSDRGNLFADLVVLEPRSGKRRAGVEGLLFGSSPGACDDESGDVCLNSRTGYDATRAPHRLRISDGAWVAEPGAPAGSRPLGDHGLIDLGSRDPEVLGRVVDGEIAWRTPATRAFPPGSTSDHGWRFSFVEDADVFVGSIGGPLERDEDDTSLVNRVDLAATGAAGLDATTGKVLWREAGTSASCFSDFDEVHVRCRSTGVGTRDGDALTWRGLTNAVEGFSPRSGETMWSVDLGKGDLPLASAEVVRAGEDAVLLASADGPIVVDLGTGETRPVEQDEAFLCSSVVEFDYEEPYYYDGSPDFQRRGGELVSPCDGAGQSTRTLPTAPLLAGTGADFDDILVLSTEEGVVGYRR